MESQQQLYFEDPWLLEFEARVLKVERLADGRQAAILDRSYFYPTSGGQEHDTGFLGAARVVDVYKDESRGVVIHIFKGQLDEGPVQATIDSERRLRHAQHHTAQHLLTQCCLRMVGLYTVSANINGYSPSTLDLAGEVQGDAWLEGVEDLANQIIFEDCPVRTYFVSPQQASSLPLHKPPAVIEDIRIVEIDGYDYAACGGTHVRSTGMIGLVKILRAERVKEKTRLHFIAGIQALETLRAYHNLLSSLAAELSVGVLEVGAVARRQAERLAAAQKELGLLRQERLGFEAHQLAQPAVKSGNCRITTAAFDGRPATELRALAMELAKMHQLVALLASYDAGKIALVVTCAPDTGLSAQALLKPILQSLDYKGGGDARIAQGGGEATIEQFQALTRSLQATFTESIRRAGAPAEMGRGG